MQRESEFVGLLSKMWKAISTKRTGWGWFFALISALVYLSDRWDSLTSFYEKLKTMGPVLKFVVDAAQSPLVQLAVFIVGVVWIGVAAILSAKASENRKHDGRPDQSPIKPSILEIACGPNVEGSVAQAWWTINGEPMPVNFFRVVVNATKESQLVKNCTGFITRIEKDRKTKWGGNNAQVTFAQGEEPDALSKTIRYPVAEYLDVLAVTSRNQVFPGTKPTIGLRLWPFIPSMDEIFSWLGDYLITVVITGDGVMPPITALLKFNWPGNWETAALTLIQESPAAQMSHIHELEHKPLTGIRLRNECDKWIETGKALRERLVMEGKAAIPEATKWIQEFQTFAELNLSVSDFDAVNAVTYEDTFNLEMTKIDPNHEVKMYQRLVGHRYGQLSIIRNKIK